MIAPITRIPRMTIRSNQCSPQLLPIHKPFIRRTTYVRGRYLLILLTLSPNTSRGIAAPERNIMGKAITIPVTWATLPVGARLAIRYPKEKKDRADMVKAASTLKIFPSKTSVIIIGLKQNYLHFAGIIKFHQQVVRKTYINE